MSKITMIILFAAFGGFVVGLLVWLGTGNVVLSFAAVVALYLVLFTITVEKHKEIIYKVQTKNHVHVLSITSEGIEVDGFKGTDLHLKVGERMHLTGGDEKEIHTSPVQEIIGG